MDSCIYTQSLSTLSDTVTTLKPYRCMLKFVHISYDLRWQCSICMVPCSSLVLETIISFEIE